MSFANKLNSLIGLVGTTNAKISRGIGVDASVVGKWRKGVRSPLNNHDTLMALSGYFAARITVEYQRQLLVSLTGRQNQNLQDEAVLRNEVYTWLAQAPAPAVGASSVAMPAAGLPAASPPGNLSFIGLEGRERALKIFVDKLEKHPSKVKLFLYFDEELAWVRSTCTYLARLGHMRPAAFAQIEQLCILVPTELARDELQSLLWMVLPFLGNQPILIYHVPRVYSSLFAHFLLVAKDFMAATAVGVRGSPLNSAIVHRSCDEVNRIVDELAARVYTGHQLLEYHKDFTMWDAFDYIGGVFSCAEDILMVGDLVFPYLLPPKAAYESIKLNEELLGPERCARVKTLLESAVDAFLAHNRLYCSMPLYLPGEVEAGAAVLPHGGAITPGAYFEMLQNIGRLCGSSPNFILAVSASAGRGASAIIQNRNRMAVAQKGPELANYLSDNPDVAGAYFQAMLEMLQSDFAPVHREESVQMLHQYIHIYEVLLKG